MLDCCILFNFNCNIQLGGIGVVTSLPESGGRDVSFRGMLPITYCLVQLALLGVCEQPLLSVIS